MRGENLFPDELEKLIHRIELVRYIFYLTLMVTLVFGSIFLYLFKIAPKTQATNTPISVTSTSGATVLNTDGKVYFSSYESNVKIDNSTRLMSGYAWSEDLGWLDFADTDSSPADPVKTDSSGHLSGKAKALNSDSYIDFNADPYHSNVEINAGVFSGYAWSEDLGWLDFAGVSAVGYNPDSSPDQTAFPSPPSNTIDSGGTEPINPIESETTIPVASSSTQAVGSSDSISIAPEAGNSDEKISGESSVLPSPKPATSSHFSRIFTIIIWILLSLLLLLLLILLLLIIYRAIKAAQAKAEETIES